MIGTVLEATQAESVKVVTVEVGDISGLEACAREFAAASKHIPVFEFARFCEFWATMIGLKAGVILSLHSDSEVVGMLGGVKHRDPYGPTMIASEFFWFVRKEYRGRGLDLYRGFEAWARENGCDQIRMVHLADSMPERLELVYKRLGFVATEVHYAKSLCEVG